MDAPRIAPIDDPSPAVAAKLTRWMPPGSPIEPLTLFRTLVRHLPLAESMRPLGSYFLGRRRTLGAREREIVIHRVCARCDCRYEWGVHAVAYGAAVGLTTAQLTATAVGDPTDPAWTEADALLIRLVDELHDTAAVSSALWRALVAHWTEVEILELLVLAGWYHAIAYVANGVRIAAEPWAAPWPEPSDHRKPVVR